MLPEPIALPLTCNFSKSKLNWSPFRRLRAKSISQAKMLASSMINLSESPDFLASMNKEVWMLVCM